MNYDEIEEDFESSNNEFSSIEPMNRNKEMSAGDRPVPIDNSPIVTPESVLKLKKGV